MRDYRVLTVAFPCSRTVGNTNNYGDAQRMAWDALRGNSVVTKVQVLEGNSYLTLDTWIIGDSGQFKRIDE